MNKGLIKKLLLICCVLAVVIIILILGLKNKSKEIEEEIEEKVMDEVELTDEQTTKIQENKEKFFTAINCIYTYLDMININNGKQLDEISQNKSIYNILSERYIQNYQVTEDNVETFVKKVNEELYFVPLEIKYAQSDDNNFYKCVIYGNIINTQYNLLKDIYMIVNLDLINNTFSIEPVSVDDINSISIEDNIQSIQPNDTNIFEYVTVNSEYIVKEYMEYYRKMVLANPEIVYNYLLDKQYKDKKFSSVEEFKKYVSDNKSTIIDLTLIKYSETQTDEYKKYTVVDNYDNYYIIKEKGVLDFTIELDNYTIESEEFISEYENASEETKIATNLDKLFKMINNKEYENIYDNYLNVEFRNRYFSNLQDFETFMKNNFFEYNYLGNKYIEKDGNYYIITINYKEGLSSAAEDREYTIIMNLKENTDFEISFNMQ